MYLYFDKKGILKTKIDHGQVARQGSPLEVTVCLDTDFFEHLKTTYNYPEFCKHYYNWGMSVEIQASDGTIITNNLGNPSSEDNFAEMAFRKLFDSEVTYDLEDYKPYIMNSVSIAANQSTDYGVALNIVFTLTATDPTNNFSYSYKLSAVKFDVEKTVGDFNQKITTKQYNNLLNEIREFAQTYTIDSTPQEDSTNLIRSGGVYDALETKADKETTYTKTQTDDLLNLKADKSNTYTKSEVYSKEDTNDLLNTKADKSDTYTKSEVYTRDEISEALGALGAEVEAHAAIQNLSGTLSLEAVNLLFDTKEDGIYRIDSEEYGPETVYIHHKNESLEGDEDLFKRYTAGYAYSYDFDLGDWQIASGGGGGTGSGTGGAITLIARSQLTQTVAVGDNVVLSYFYRSTAGNLGTMYLYADSVLKKSESITKGENSVNISEWVKNTPTAFKIEVYDAIGNKGYLDFVISGVELKIVSYFDDSIVTTGNVDFVYTPYGGTDKTIHYILDDIDVTETFQVSGSESTRTYRLPQMTHGVHDFSVYMTSVINDNIIRSNTLSYKIMYDDGVSNDIIIASKFNQTNSIQGQLISIDYIVYDPHVLQPTVTLKINNEVKLSNLQTNRNKKYWNITNYPAGNVVFTIEATGEENNTASISFPVAVAEPDIDISAETEGLELYLANINRSNYESPSTLSTWEYGNYSATMTNFNWSANGWVNDDDGYPILRVNGTAQVVIPIKIFATEFSNSGKTFEIDFKVQDVVNNSTVLVSCFSNNIGFRITANECLFKTSQNTITTKFKEEERIRLSFVIEPKNNSNRLIKIFINGVLSAVEQYDASDNFVQASPANITINQGGGYIDIYSIRVYNNVLTNRAILKNFIADKSLTEQIEAYYQNDIFDDFGNVSYAKIKNLIPVLTIEGVLPASKGDKKKVACRYEDPLDGTRNFYYEKCTIDVQGTSSQYFPRKNYKIKFPEKFALYEGAVQEETYTFKADYMESSHSHNTGCAKIINELSPANPAQVEGSGIRNAIYGFPIAIFFKNTTLTNSTLEYYGIFNFNNDKGNAATIGLSTDLNNPSLHCESWEFEDSARPICVFKSGDFTDLDAVSQSLEPRYPEFEDGHIDYTNIAAVISWVASTYITNNDTEEQRAAKLAKFEEEFELHFNKDFCLFYYIMMDVFLATDSRAKNMFLDTWDGTIWYPRWYDIDTVFGLNNDGRLLYSYNLEQQDPYLSGYVFNGHDSVLWNNFGTVFADDIKDRYNEMRAGNLTYDKIMSIINGEQISKISPAMYNSDGQFKYVDALLNNLGNYLYVEQGSRIEHFKWWLKNRFNYLDSKYQNTNYKNDYITIRAYYPSDSATISAVAPNYNFVLKPYVGMYCSVKYDSDVKSVRGYANTNTTITAPSGYNTPTNSIVNIYGASQLLDIGNLASKYAGVIDVKNATRLSGLIAGSSNNNYENTNLTLLDIGTNNLLKNVDVRGCTNLSGTLDLSGCQSIQTVYANRTQLTSVSLPENGGNLTTLYLPDTTTTLVVKNQPFLSSFSLGTYAHLTRVELENTPILTPALIQNIVSSASGLTNLTLSGIDWTLDNSYVPIFNTLAMPGKNITINGHIHITGTVYEEALNTWIQHFGANVIIEADNIIRAGDETELIAVIGDNEVNQVQTFIQHSNSANYESIVIAVNWGDGVAQTINLNTYNYRLTHTYTEKGTYSIKFVLYYSRAVTEAKRLGNTLRIMDSTALREIKSFQSEVWSIIAFNEYPNNTSGASSSEQTNHNFCPNLKKIAPFPSSMRQLNYCGFLKIGSNVSSQDNELDITFEPTGQDIYLSYCCFRGNIKSVTLNERIAGAGGFSSSYGPSLNTSICNTENNLYYLGTENNPYYLLCSSTVASGSAVALNNGTKIISDGMFKNVRITAISFNSGLLSIGSNFLAHTNSDAFSYSRQGVQVLIIPDSVTQIGQSFMSLQGGSSSSGNSSASNLGLLSIQLGSGLTSISSNFLYLHTRLATLTIPANITSISSSILQGANPYLIVDSNNTVYDSRNECNAIIETATNTLIKGNGKTDLSLATNIEVIGSSAFYGWPGNSYGADAYLNLQNIGWNSSITTIRSGAFQYCTNLTSLDLSNVTSIGYGAFSYCYGVLISNEETLLIPANTELQTGSNQGPFSYCRFESITFEDGRTDLPSYCFNNSSVKEIIMPNSITTIGSYCFASCRSLQTITLSNSLTSIPYRAFDLNRNVQISNGEISRPTGGIYTSLTELIIPNSVTSIGGYAFESLAGITEITLPENLTNIDGGAFYDCSGLTAITIPDNVITMGTSVFRYCDSLETAVLSNGLTAVPNSTFYYCTKLESCTLPTNVLSIQDFAFYKCTSLSEISLPSTLLTIGTSAFSNTALVEIELPSAISSIGSMAFYECASLQTIIINAIYPPSLGALAFSTNENMKIKVPHGTLSRYQAATGWAAYADYLEEQEEE